METEDQEKEIRLCEEPIVLGKEEYFAGDGIDISDENVISIDKNVVQEKLTAGTGININEQNDISVDTDTIQEKLTAGNNINISEQNVISATDTTYTAGENVNISAQNVISATDTKYTAGKNITISEQNVISAADGEVYTAGDNITIENNVISATDTTYTAGNAISIDSSDNNRIDADIHPADYFTADASELIADGSAEGTIQATFKSVELYGDTTQQTYTGKNLFDISKVLTNSTHLVNNGDGTLTVDLTNGASGAAPNTLGTFCPQLNIGDTVVLSFKTTGSTNNIYLGSPASQTWEKDSAKTITQNMLDAPVIWYGGSGNTPVTYSNFQIELGSTSTAYEPYVGGVPAPNPDYPQNVNVVTGTQTVKINGKNLFDRTNASPNALLTWATGVESPHTGSITSDYVIASEGVTFIANYTVIPFLFDKSKNYIGVLKTNGNVSKTSDYAYHTGSFTIPSGYNVGYVRLSFRSSQGDSPSDLTDKNIMVNHGSTLEPYEPYQSQSYTVRLGSLELAKIGDYQDYIYKSGDDWYVHKEIRKYTFTGSESFTKSGYSTTNAWAMYWTTTSLHINVEVDNGYCNFGTVRYLNGMGATLNGVVFNNSTGSSFVKMLKSMITNWDESATDSEKITLAKNMIAGKAFYYVIANPTDTKITDADLVSDLNALASGYSYADETNFTITATGTNLPAPMEFEVYKNSLAGMAEVLAGKQDKLVAGSNINITGNVISALGGGSSVIQTLTAADFNWDSTGQGGEPNAVAAWLLNEGWYCASVETHPNTTSGSLYENSLLYVYHEDQDPDMNTVFTISGQFGGLAINYVDSNGDLTDRQYEIDLETLIMGYEDNLPRSEAFAPTTAEEGALGQLFTDTDTMHTYQCTAIDDSDPDNIEYTWTLRW